MSENNENSSSSKPAVEMEAIKAIDAEQPLLEKPSETTEANVVAGGDEEKNKTPGCLASTILPYIGYIYAVLTAISFCIANILIKKALMLSGAEQLTILFIVKIVMMLAVCKYVKKSPLGPAGPRKMLSIRGAVGVLGLLSLYTGLLFLPPSDCSAVSNTSIIITAILARIFLKDKLGITHIVAILLAVIGVIFISKPSIIFPRPPSTIIGATSMAQLANNDSSSNYSNSSNQQEAQQPQQSTLFNANPATLFTIGIVMALFSGLFFGILSILMKKLDNVKVHWAVNTIYAAYVGLPVCIILSFVSYKIGLAHQNLEAEYSALPSQLFFSFLSAIFAVLGQVFLNLAIAHEDPTKVSIVKTVDVFIAFLLQYIFLNISVDAFSVLGSIAIILGSVLVLGMSMIEKKLEASTTKGDRGRLVGCLLKKF